jgi:hypothetical protein
MVKAANVATSRTAIPSDLLLTEDAAKRVGVSVGAFRAIVKRGKVPVAWRPTYHTMLFDPVDLDRFRAARAIFRGPMGK